MTKLIRKYQGGGGAAPGGSSSFASTLGGALNSADSWLGSAGNGKVWNNINASGQLLGAITGDQNIGKWTSQISNVGNSLSNLAKITQGTGEAAKTTTSIANIGTNLNSGFQAIKGALSGTKAADGVTKIGGIKGAIQGFKSLGDGAKAASAANVLNLGSTALGAINSLTGLDNKREYKGENGAITQGLDTVWDMGASAASFAGPIGAAVGLGMNALKTVGNVANKLGAGTDAMTTQDAILGSNLFSWNLGMINGALGKTVDKTFTLDQDVMNNTGSGYQNFAAYAPTANKASGKKYGLLSRGARKRGEAAIEYANAAQNVLTDISEEGERAKAAADYYGIGYANDLLLQGGFQPTMVARHGSKLVNKERIKRAKNIAKSLKTGGAVNQVIIRPSIDDFVIERIPSFEITLEEPKPVVEPPLGKYRSGGKLGDTNVIPEGALHAHLNKMDGADEDFTKKGIPVITEEKGKIEQHAEIERNEIIFRKEVTEKLEELMKKDTDEAAIEAGELLVKEILFNTEDNTGLLKEVD